MTEKKRVLVQLKVLMATFVPTIWFNGALYDSNLGDLTENHQFACALKQIRVSFPNINGIRNGISDFNALYPSVIRALTLIEYSV